MKTTLRTRKPIDKLTLADLKAFPIWEWAGDEEAEEEQDETWIRPVGLPTLPVGTDSLLVSISMIASSGKRFAGFAEAFYPGTPEEDLSTPIFIFGRRHVHTEGLHARELEATLGLPKGGLFPLRVRVNVLVHGAKNHWEFLYKRSEA